MRPSAEVRVVVRSVSFTGNTLFNDAELQKSVAAYLGKEQNAEGLNQLLRDVAAVYRRAGYFLAQAYFPKQDLGIKDRRMMIFISSDLNRVILHRSGRWFQ